MKKRRLLYISLVLLLAGCAKEADLSNTQSGEGKTPLLINATLSTSRAQTRASGSSFANGDQLKAYVRHLDGSSNPIDPDYGKKLVTITYNGSSFSSDAYWDDFSNSSAAATDVRTSGHGLHSLYAYCYNGGETNNKTSITESSGVLGWRIGTLVENSYIDQTSETNVQNADLLWAPEIDKVAYSHGTSHDADHSTLSLLFSHAMSQITVTVTAQDGFIESTNPLSSTILTLNSMNTVTQWTPSTSPAFSPPIQETAGNIKNVRMYAGEPYPATNALVRTYYAIVAPGTKLLEGQKLLDITNAHGNDYTVTITAAMLSTENGKWGNGLAGDNQIGGGEGNHYIVTQPGKHYHLDVNIKKSAVQAHATLTDWASPVNASGEGEIVLTDDETNLIMDDGAVSGITGIDVVAVDKNHFTGSPSASSFSLFRVKDDAYHDTAEERTNEAYDFCTVSTFQDNADDANDQWNNDPAIYWPNINDNYYFRALAKFNSSTGSAPNIVNNISSVGDIYATPEIDKGTTVSQGTEAAKDILWGTTPKHKGYSNTIYERGAKIPPRKGGVPIAFEHAMSKVSFNLTTTNDADVLATNAKVDLTNAKVAVINLHTTGTISIESGTITGGGINSNEAGESSAIPNHTYPGSPISNLFVIPQDFSNGNAKVVVTLANGAIYSVPLKDCKASVTGGGYTANDNISSWIRGKNYTYTIHIEKESVQAHVLVKDWKAVAGSGTATLEW